MTTKGGNHRRGTDTASTAVGSDRKFPICNDPKFLTLGLSLKAYRAVLLALPTERPGTRMYKWEIRMLLKHYLDRGVSKAELSRRFGVNRRTIHNWVDTGQLDRDLAAGARGYSPRPPVAHKLTPYKAIIDARLEAFPKLSAKRLFDEVRAAPTRLPRARPSPTPQTPRLGVRPHAQSEKFSIDKSGKFSVAIDIAAIMECGTDSGVLFFRRSQRNPLGSTGDSYAGPRDSLSGLSIRPVSQEHRGRILPPAVPSPGHGPHALGPPARR